MEWRVMMWGGEDVGEGEDMRVRMKVSIMVIWG